MIEDDLRANVIAKIKSHISNKDAVRKTANSCDTLDPGPTDSNGNSYNLPGMKLKTRSSILQDPSEDKY